MAFFTTQQAELLAASTARVAWLAELQFKSQTERLWSGNTNLSAASQTWRPTHGAVQVDGLGFSGEAVSRQITMSLSGVDGSLLALAMAETEEADQQPFLLYFQLFDEDWQTVGGLIPAFYGLMQPPKVSRSEIDGIEGPVQTITLPIENMFYNRARPANGRYTDRDQQNRSPGDKFFEFMPSLTFKTIRFPDF